FALLLLLNGLSMGAFASPNRAGVMNSLPPQHRGAGAGMNSTFQNSAQVLSIGIFFSLMIAGLAPTLHTSLYAGLTAHGVPAAAATRVGHLPPVSILFGAFLGYSPIQHLVGSSVLAHLPPRQAAILVGRSFFPDLISGPFRSGLHAAFDFAILACLVAAVASWLRGGQYHWRDEQDSANAGSAGQVPEAVGARQAGMGASP
ncbi:MAG: MFS transporter, partial [Acidimicrobiales bacterium]